MMKEIKPGSYAFYEKDPPAIINKGEMTLRDYFASSAMQGLIERYDCELPLDIAREAYDYADAMLEARRPKP
jgi:hypothetical protein